MTITRTVPNVNGVVSLVCCWGSTRGFLSSQLLQLTQASDWVGQLSSSGQVSQLQVTLWASCPHLNLCSGYAPRDGVGVCTIIAPALWWLHRGYNYEIVWPSNGSSNWAQTDITNCCCSPKQTVTQWPPVHTSTLPTLSEAPPASLILLSVLQSMAGVDLYTFTIYLHSTKLTCAVELYRPTVGSICICQIYLAVH